MMKQPSQDQIAEAIQADDKRVYPQAHEDDAELAVRAGLEVIAAVTALKVPVPLQTRVGIATGMVVVGDLIGSGEAQERGIVGETPNLAARLQGIWPLLKLAPKSQARCRPPEAA